MFSDRLISSPEPIATMSLPGAIEATVAAIFASTAGCPNDDLVTKVPIYVLGDRRVSQRGPRSKIGRSLPPVSGHR